MQILPMSCASTYPGDKGRRQLKRLTKLPTMSPASWRTPSRNRTPILHLKISLADITPMSARSRREWFSTFDDRNDALGGLGTARALHHRARARQRWNGNGSSRRGEEACAQGRDKD